MHLILTELQTLVDAFESSVDLTAITSAFNLAVIFVHFVVLRLARYARANVNHVLKRLYLASALLW